jgi:nucleotide-binding universal stress UspA family protein
MAQDQYRFQMAIQDFQAARQKAGLQEILSRVTGKSNDLLSYEEVAGKLRLNIRTERGNKSIPLDAIAGSVGRNTDFTRTFLPLRNDDRQRWARVKAAFDTDPAGLPPIEVYQVGQVYFVIDGNHRVSIARQEKLDTIEAHVIEVQTDIPLTAEMPSKEVDRLIIQSEQTEFLAETRILDLRPNVDLTVTACYQYEKLLEQIRLRLFLLQQESQDKVPFEEAVLDWFDHVYTPLAEAIRDRGLLRWFPDRTLTDFYIWICEYHTELEKETGWLINPENVATALSVKESHTAENVLSSTGGWRASRMIDRYTDKLFNDILIPISGDPASWQSLDQAILIARQESASLHGLHVVASEEQRTSAFALELKQKFNNLCAQAGVKGALVIEAGDIVHKISARARLADLTVLKIVNPPLGGLASLKSPFRAVINGASGPILGLPASASKLDRALVAFDGSPRSREALFVGAYLAEKWKTSLTVFTALEEGRTSASVQDYACRYLEFHEVEADFILENGSPHVMQKFIAEGGFNLLLLGSYGTSVLREVFIGNTLDFALRESRVPILICR